MNTSTTPTKAAIYLRISLDRTGEGLAVDRQREDCERIAAARGWEVVGYYTDNSVSASKRTVRRPEYERMVADYDAGGFEAIVCWDLDRLTRQPRQLEDWIELAEDRGLLLVTANGEADLTTDGGRMYARIKASVARAEVERKSARQTRAWQQRADLGKPPSGPRLTGYERDGSIISAEAELVRWMFDTFAGGETLLGLTERLASEGETARDGKRWARGTVRGILTNPRYAGRAVYRGETTGKSGTWKPIIADDIFDAVQARLNDPRRKTNRVGNARSTLGSGLYLCGVCDARLVTNSTSYWCLKGGHVSRTKRLVDDHVLAVIHERLTDPGAMDALPRAEDGAARALDDEAGVLRSRLAAVEADYDAGYIDGRRFAVATEKIAAELTAVERRRVNLLGSHGAVRILTAADPIAAFDAASLDEQREALGALAVVRVHRSPAGRKGFAPDTVDVILKEAEVV